MEANSISGDALCNKYGVDYSDILAQQKGQFFFHTCCMKIADDRVSLHGVTDSNAKSTILMFWLPHLRRFLDFPALYAQQNERRQAVQLLGSCVRRRWILSVQNQYATRKLHYSIDCLVLSLLRNEKKRVLSPNGVVVPRGGPAWAFHEMSKGGMSKFSSRNQTALAQYHRLLVDYEDWVVE
jgi:hypothetical protein